MCCCLWWGAKRRAVKLDCCWAPGREDFIHAHLPRGRAVVGWTKAPLYCWCCWLEPRRFETGTESKSSRPRFPFLCSYSTVLPYNSFHSVTLRQTSAGCGHKKGLGRLRHCLRGERLCWFVLGMSVPWFACPPRQLLGREGRAVLCSAGQMERVRLEGTVQHQPDAKLPTCSPG